MVRIALLLGLLQVHAVDKVIGFFRGERSSLLQLMSHQAQPAAHHEQQKSTDEDAQDKWQNGT